MIARTAPGALVLTLILGTTALARADESPPVADSTPGGHPSRVHLDAQPGVALPLGDLSLATGPALGGFVGGGYTLDDRWEVGGRVGYLWGASTKLQVAGASIGTSLSYAPVLAAAKYYLLDPGAVRLYLAAEAGAVLVVSSASGAGGDASASSLDFGGAASVGMQIDLLDLRAGVMTADLGHTGTSTSALMTLGFRFAAL